MSSVQVKQSRRIGTMTLEETIKLGDEEIAQGKWTDACVCFHKALDELEKKVKESGPGSRTAQKYKPMEGIIRSRIGHCYRMTGRFEDARKEFETVRSIAEELRDERLLGEAFMGLGFVAWRNDDHKMARREFNKAIEMADRIHNRYIKGMALMGLGNLDLVVRRLDEGVKVYEEAGAILESVREARMDYARLLHNLAFLYFKKGDHAKARANYTKALNISETIGDVHISGFVHSNMALLYLEEGNVKEAEAAVEKAGRLLARSNDKIGLNLVGWVKGLIKFKSGKTADALEHFRKAKRGFEELGMSAQILNMTADYMPVFKAAEHKKEAIEVLSALKKQFTQKDLPEMRARIEELEREVKG